MQITQQYLIAALLVLPAIYGCEKRDAQATKTNAVAVAEAEAVADADLNKQPAEKVKRWYPGEFVLHGSRVYQTHCESCHGVNATGASKDWRKRKPDDQFPPPPLNGTGHAWHHSLPVLLQTISSGSIDQGGEMPAFKDSLTTDERLSVVAYFQQFWPDEIYASWAQNFPAQFKQSTQN